MHTLRKNLIIFVVPVVILSLFFMLCSCSLFEGKEETEYITEDIARSVLLDALDTLDTSTNFVGTFKREYNSEEQTQTYAITGEDKEQVIKISYSSDYEDYGTTYHIDAFECIGWSDAKNKYVFFSDQSFKNLTTKKVETDKQYTTLTKQEFKDFISSGEFGFDDPADVLFYDDPEYRLKKNDTIVTGKKISNRKNTKYEINLSWEKQYSYDEGGSAKFYIENGKITSYTCEMNDGDEYTTTIEYGIKPLSLPDTDEYEYVKDLLD